jgi:hypothetical protein
MARTGRCTVNIDTSSVTKKDVAVAVGDYNCQPCCTPFTPPPSFDNEEEKQPGDDDDDDDDDYESVVSDITMHFQENGEEGEVQTRTVRTERAVFHHQEGTPPRGAITGRDHFDDFSTNNRYGYEDAAPTTATKATFSPTNKIPRRSSLKSYCSEEDQQRRRRMIQRRRASIGVCEEIIQVRLPTHEKPVWRRRSIFFHGDVVVHQVTPASSLAGSTDALWINDDEYDEIKDRVLEIVETVHVARRGARGRKATTTPSTPSSSSSSKYCSRGLEKLLSPEIVQLKKMQAVECVMQEQFLQRKMGDYNEEVLAKIYKYSTMRSRLEACKRAGEDAKEAEEYLRPYRTMFPPHRRASIH